MKKEKRLIDAYDLLREIDGVYQRHYANSSYQFIHDFFRAMFRRIWNAPTVEAVEVVRCKDCKYYHADTLSCDFTPHSKYYERPNWYEADYCSYGERKNK